MREDEEGILMRGTGDEGEEGGRMRALRREIRMEGEGKEGVRKRSKKRDNEKNERKIIGGEKKRMGKQERE